MSNNYSLTVGLWFEKINNSNNNEVCAVKYQLSPLSLYWNINHFDQEVSLTEIRESFFFVLATAMVQESFGISLGFEINPVIILLFCDVYVHKRGVS